MKKKKIITLGCMGIFLVLIVIIMIALFQDNNKVGQEELSKGSLEQVKDAYALDIEKLKNGEYENLIYCGFTSSIDGVEEVYNIEIHKELSYNNRTFLENFVYMKAAIEKFFPEELDKSLILADFTETNEKVPYYEIEKVCGAEIYNPGTSFLFVNNTRQGGYMVQIAENLMHAWFSKGAFGDNYASDYIKVYPYVSGIRQNEVIIKFKDGDVSLEEMERRVLEYMKNDFPLPYSEDIVYGIGDVRILPLGEYEGVTFKLRRTYKGIPFEYGSTSASGEYIDKVGHDAAELIYADSQLPDTLMGFGAVNSTVVETKEISELITAGKALQLLSEKIGDNSVYDVHGVELVYRAQEMDNKEQSLELEGVYVPKWKILTVNQNDSKYTLFYVDAVTGEITERFEYYYE